MGDEQQPGLAPVVPAKPLIVKCGDHQVPEIMTARPLQGQFLKNALLERMGLQIKKHGRSRVILFPGPFNGLSERHGIIRIIRQKLPAVPVGLKFSGKLFQDMA